MSLFTYKKYYIYIYTHIYTHTHTHIYIYDQVYEMLTHRSHMLRLNISLAFHIKIENISTRLPYRYFTRYENITLKRDIPFLTWWNASSCARIVLKK